MTLMTEYPDGLFCWVDLVAHDLEAAKRWYAELFGWTVEAADTRGGPPYAMFRKHGQLVAAAGQMSAEMIGAGVPAMWNNYVSTSDCAATEARALKLGARVGVPTMQVMDAGWLCFLQDPTGAMFALWQPNEHHGAELVNAPGSFCWNELATSDVAAAQEFYAELFGWTFDTEGEGDSAYHVIKSGGRENGGMITLPVEDMPPSWTAYFAVDDLDASLAKAIETGAKLLYGPSEIAGVGPIAVVADPQGAWFTLIQLTHPPG